MQDGVGGAWVVKCSVEVEDMLEQWVDKVHHMMGGKGKEGRTLNHECDVGELSSVK